MIYLESSNLVLLALGSNLGDRERLLREGCDALNAACGTLLAKASIVNSRPLGTQANQMFLNTAVVLATAHEPLTLLDKLQEIEKKFGRERSLRWGNRTLDIDIILWRTPTGEPLVLDHPLLKIPHPAALERDFVLVPASQIAGDWRHPHTGATLSDECQKLCSEPDKHNLTLCSP